MQKFIHNKSVAIASITLISAMITACGGGEDQTSKPVANEPIQITDSSWDNQKSASKSIKAPTITTQYKRNGPTTRSWMALMMNIDGVTDSKHFQIHIDMDNDPTTGYQFEYDAWSSLSGVDYIIENGTIFESTANDATWSWKELAPDYQTQQGGGKIIMSGGSRTSPSAIRASLSTKFLNKLCGDFNIGYIGIDENWQIENFYPKANKLLAQNVSYCYAPPQNTVPLITLKGSKSMVVEINSTFVDPGAKASDKEDGDITSQIKKVQMVYNPPGVYVDTSKLGLQRIQYNVTDSGGLVGYATRDVHVVKKANKITIDGNIDDWLLIDDFAVNNNTTMKVTDDKENFYIMIDSSDLTGDGNWQIFLNSIGDTSGHVSGYAAALGADYLVENGSFAKFTGKSSYQWAWDFNISQLVMTQSGNVVEIMIPKLTLNPDNRAAGLRLNFTSLDSNWQDNYSIGGNKYYSYTSK